MTLNEIIRIANNVYLDNVKAPTLWQPEDLELFANEAQKEACKRKELITDDSTVSICQVSIVSGTSVYAVSPKITRVQQIRLASDTTYNVSAVSEEWLNDIIPQWYGLTGTVVLYFFHKDNKIRFVPQPTESDTAYLTVARLPLAYMTVEGISITGTTDISFSATAKTITKPGANFKLSGIVPGMILTVTDTTLNNTDFTVASVTETVITTEETPVLETNQSATIEGDFVPEIPETYHMDLVDWICHLCYNKRDSETEDAARETKYSKRFDDKFGPRPSAQAAHYRKYLPRDGQMRSNSWFRF